ncbi:F-box protein CPR1 [Manihot esculenta]|uniref:F-box protein CPR1 n=1 Tax=Manihot esculenta TaxID=3983 RepID=UPI000B5D4861|nr:F-box protein CPR1 [Manihot esculenta]
MKFDYDLLVEILCRLPVESLLRFRCLSKTCCSCIDSPDFIKLHLNRSIKTRTNRSLVIHEILPKGSTYAIDLDSSESNRHPMKLHHKFHGDVFGSCNGLLAIYNGEDLTLWNPATKKHRNLPRFWDHCQSDDKMLRGFGYNAENDDYKVIVITQLFFMYHPTFWVYSLKANSLTRTDVLIDCSIINDNRHDSVGVFAGGSVHWVVNRRGYFDNKVILAFNLNNESFCELPKPRTRSTDLVMYLGELGGSLAISYPWDCEIWVMKEYGVEESWTKLFYVSHFRNGMYYKICDPYLKPLCYSKTETGHEALLVVQDSEYFLLCDLEKEGTKKLAIFGSLQHKRCNRISANICVRSLVPINFDF